MHRTGEGVGQRLLPSGFTPSRRCADFKGVWALLCSQEAEPENPRLWDGTWIWGTGEVPFIQGPSWARRAEKKRAVVPGSSEALPGDEQPGKQGGQVLADPGRGEAEPRDHLQKDTFLCPPFLNTVFKYSHDMCTLVRTGLESQLKLHRSSAPNCSLRGPSPLPGRQSRPQHGEGPRP